jgi:hypothetical protein
VERLLERVRGVDIDELIALEPRAEGPPQRAALARLTAELLAAFPDIADGLNHAYLAHAVPRRQPPSAGVAAP